MTTWSGRRRWTPEQRAGFAFDDAVSSASAQRMLDRAAYDRTLSIAQGPPELCAAWLAQQFQTLARQIREALPRDPAKAAEALREVYERVEARARRPRAHILDYLSHPRDPGERQVAFALCGIDDECSGSGVHSFQASGSTTDCDVCRERAAREIDVGAGD